MKFGYVDGIAFDEDTDTFLKACVELLESRGRFSNQCLKGLLVLFLMIYVSKKSLRIATAWAYLFLL